MLGISKALEQFKAFPDDPYVVIPNTNIELRLGDDNMIIGAYNADEPDPQKKRWASDEFKAILAANRNRRMV